MKKNIARTITLIIITQVLLSSACLIIYSNGTPIETQVGFGTAPVIDGIIDVTKNEWNSAEKLSIALFQDLTNQTNGLPIDLWILQSESSINFLIHYRIILCVSI